MSAKMSDIIAQLVLNSYLTSPTGTCNEPIHYI